VDDMDSQGNVRAAGRGVQDSGSVLIKLSHRDPAKAVIKKHNSLVLRAESPADKYSWLVRLKRCAEGEVLGSWSELGTGASRVRRRAFVGQSMML